MIECKICKENGIIKEFSRNTDLSRHISKVHAMDKGEYYKKYINPSATGICPICHKPTKFDDFTKGFSKFCSKECAFKSKDVIEKRKATCRLVYGGNSSLCSKEVQAKAKASLMKFYGVDHASKNADVKLKISISNKRKSEEAVKKRVKTNLLKYNVDSTSKLESVKLKTKATNLRKYGAVSALQNKIVAAKAEATMMSKYNVKKALQSEDLKSKMINTVKRTYNVDNYSKSMDFAFRMNRNTFDKYKEAFNNLHCELLDINSSGIRFKCNICNTEATLPYDAVITDRLKFNITPCRVCKPKFEGSSYEEESLVKFIKSFGYDIDLKNRSILDGKEIDIYIPALNIGIEYNGLYWHSDRFQSPLYHLQKSLLAESKGIRLIQIFSDEWLYKTDIVKSRIASIFNKTERIYARKCIIKKFSSAEYNDVKEFLNKNHIQGNCHYSVAYGLLYDNEIVSIMTFGTSRFKPDEIELLRFCNKLNFTVVGAAGKLFKAYIKEFNPDKIVSYADRRWSIGNLYNTLGFTFESASRPSYSYVLHGHKRLNRMNFQKARLVKLYPDKANLSETQIMKELGYDRIYDCGNLKFVYINNHNLK